MDLPPSIASRIGETQVIWFATVRPSGAPHLVPIWSVFSEGRIYLVTDRNSVKVRNLEHNNRAVVALEDGNNPLILEGLAKVVPTLPDAAREEFQRKYDWEVGQDPANAFIEFEAVKILSW